jgi:hypothetical protein
VTPELLAAIGKTAKVHWHVTKRVYSIAVKGKVIGYVPECTLTNCNFKIDKRLRAAFVAKPSRRTVHALITGTIVSYEADCVQGETVYCNPFKFASFVRALDEREATSAETVLLHSDKRIEAIGLICS